MSGFNAVSMSVPTSRLKPSSVSKAAEAVVAGAVMGIKMQPYEAHIPYLLQFMMDMNLCGMGLLLCRAVRFRKDPPKDKPSSAPHGWQHDLTQAMHASAGHTHLASVCLIFPPLLCRSLCRRCHGSRSLLCVSHGHPNNHRLVSMSCCG
jgi:hypothetical protein